MPPFIYPSIADGLLQFFQFGAITNITSINIVVIYFLGYLNVVGVFLAEGLRIYFTFRSVKSLAL